MNLPLFLARGLQNSSADNRKRQLSRPAVRIAMAGVAVGIAIMILSVAIVTGFKAEIQSKILGLTSNVQITNYQSLYDKSQVPLWLSDTLHNTLLDVKGVAYVDTYSETQGVMMTDSAFLGVKLKGLSTDYDTTFLVSTLLAGRLSTANDEMDNITVSETIAKQLNLDIGSRVYTYFIEGEAVRTRRFTVTGIYQTNFSDIDETTVFTTQRIVQKLNNWTEQQVGCIEIRLKHYEDTPATTALLRYRFDGHGDGYGGMFRVMNVEELNPALFAWLGLLDMNVWVILIIIMGVAAFTLISGLLIIILEQTSAIGVLKALGAKNKTLRSTFLYVALNLVGRGMLYGNIAALVLYFVQQKWLLFRLNPETYYIDHVPVQLHMPVYLLLNAAVFLLATLILLLPTHIISRISPSRSIRYE